jgi:hypothetical protein
MIWSKTKGIISAQLESQNKVVLLPIVNVAWVNIDGKVLDNLAQHIS